MSWRLRLSMPSLFCSVVTRAGYLPFNCHRHSGAICWPEPEMMKRCSYLLFSRKISPVGVYRWSQRRHYTNVLYPRASLGLPLVSFLSLTAFVGCSWSRLNLDSNTEGSSSTRESSREHQKGAIYHNESYMRNDGIKVPVHHPQSYTQAFEQTVFPGDHTGVARYDTAKSGSQGCVSLAL